MTNRYSTNRTLKSIASALLLATVGISSVSAQEADIDNNFAWRMFQGSDILTQLSPETRSIYTAPFIRPMADDATGTFRATTFAPLIFDVDKLLSLREEENEIRSIIGMTNRTLFPQAESLNIIKNASKDWIANTSFGKNQKIWKEAMGLREYIFRTNPDMVVATTAGLPQDRLADSRISGKEYNGAFKIHTNKKAMVDGITIQGEEIAPKYWKRTFQADLHFAQNEISSNWYKGGQSNLNLNGRLFFDATYSKDKVKWVNQLEYKVGIFTQTNPEQKKLQIGEDIFTIISNLGLRASKNWFYTIDGMLRTQMLNNYSTNNVLVTRTFAPMKADLGIGMKYDVDVKQLWGDPFARFRFTANVSPLSAQLIYSWANDVDKARVGLLPDQNFLFRLGSTVRANMTWDFTSYLYWESRVLYNTSYKHVETEFENNIYYALSRFFSVKLGVNLRYDDSVISDTPKTLKDLIQYNQIFSLGFTYKL